jgi:hypothetical protein
MGGPHFAQGTCKKVYRDVDELVDIPEETDNDPESTESADICDVGNVLEI